MVLFDDIEHGLARLLQASGWPEKKAVLQREKVLWKTDIAEKMLEQSAQNAENVQLALFLRSHARILRFVRENGGEDVAWKALDDHFDVPTPLKNNSRLYSTLSEWFAIPTDKRRLPEQQSYLKEHLNYLLHPDVEAHIELLIKKTYNKGLLVQDGETSQIEEGKEAARTRKLLLRYVRERGGTAQAVHDGYINFHGGLLRFDIPDWLEQAEQELDRLFEKIGGWQDRIEYQDKLTRIVERAKRDRDIARETLAELYCLFGDALPKMESVDQESCKKAIMACKDALQIYTLERYPNRYAKAQHNLSNAYRLLEDENRPANLEQAISCDQAALRVWTREDYPHEWAMVQQHLTRIYYDRVEGERKNNLELAMRCGKDSLDIFQRTIYPYEWALSQNLLGMIYQDRIEGVKWENQKQAIDHYEATLGELTEEMYADEWAMIQNNLGALYRERIQGQQWENQERAIEHYRKALKVYERDTSSIKWARTQNNLGTAYLDRQEGEALDNLEQAIGCFEAAFEIYSREHLHSDSAMILQNLGVAYSQRAEHATLEEPGLDIERAIAYFHAALEIRTRETMPREWARTQNNLASAYQDRVEGERPANLENAIESYRAALQVFTEESFPVEWADIQLNLGSVYNDLFDLTQKQSYREPAIGCFEKALSIFTLEAFPWQYWQAQTGLALIKAGQQRWSEAQSAFAGAFEAEEMLARLSTGIQGRDMIFGQWEDVAIYNGFALARSGQAQAAAIAMERGRARSLAAAMALNAGDPALISNLSLRERYIDTCQQLIKAEAALNVAEESNMDASERRALLLERMEITRCAKIELDKVMSEIRIDQDLPNYFDNVCDAATISRAAAVGGDGHALVYIASTPWGGMVVTAWNTYKDQLATTRFEELYLPALTNDFVNEFHLALMQDSLPLYAAIDTALAMGGTFHDVVERLSRYLFPSNGMTPKLYDEIQGTLNDLRQKYLVGLSLSDEDEVSMLTSRLWSNLLSFHIRKTLQGLREVLMLPLTAWLLEKKKIKSVTLIPCGHLATLALTAVEVGPKQTFGDLFVTSVVPNARSLLIRQSVHRTREGRSGVYTLGNPKNQMIPLPWSEAEAWTIGGIARRLELYFERKIQKDATRDWLLRALRQGLVVDAACHAVFDPEDFLRSTLFLAGSQKLTLESLLSSEVDMRGLRLFILSCCETSKQNGRGAVNEVHSLAAGVLQSGADAAMASLWDAHDEATYLLMVCFAEEWLPRMDTEPPAAALARAQEWLRTVSNSELREWRYNQDDIIEMNVRSEAQKGDHKARPFADPIYWAGFQVIGW